MPRHRWQRDGYFDVWMPILAPSHKLLRRVKAQDMRDDAAWRRFIAAYDHEMAQTEPRQAIELLAALALKTPISIGCHCCDERRCHRSHLDVLIERAAERLSKMTKSTNVAATPGEKAAATRKRRAAGRKTALTRKRRAAGRKAALTRKRRAAGWKTAAR